MCTAVLIAWDPATPPLPCIWTSITRALLVSKDRQQLCVTPWFLPSTAQCPPGVTKRCRLSLLTNSALAIRVQMRGEGGSCGVSANEYSCTHHVTWSLNKLWDLPPYLTYTVTRPYEGFRHPDRMAPESTVRGRENDSLVRPGYLHPLLTRFSGGSGIFRRFTLWKKDGVTQLRIELTSFRLLILSFTPRPQLPDTIKHKI